MLPIPGRPAGTAHLGLVLHRLDSPVPPPAINVTNVDLYPSFFGDSVDGVGLDVPGPSGADSIMGACRSQGTTSVSSHGRCHWLWKVML